ncbi:DNA-binding protein [Burkholderia sp. WAC0059]|uniref:DNA-binding protein n=1 Tax=Burkholderia sp. WAC0059 TaxID=2066022 RepID=UPI000C7F433B|nr:DNA-binding protein [Burkholderia sp. WAC0059]PLZ04129.1 DNA-binding protein [Burkholderia sp. WAC0059]
MTVNDERFAIREELDVLRKNGAKRQELSLHACKRLFFDLGIRPSMASVRELTQTGSASDIPKDIELFWQRIRNASKVRIGGGAIPPMLEEQAGELLGLLFDAALAQARSTLEGERTEMQAASAGMEQRVRDAESRREAAEGMLQRSEAQAETAWTRVRELEAQLAASTAHDRREQDGWQATAHRLENENEVLRKRIDAELSANATLHDRIDALNRELRERTEHYAQQIKDALSEAERRVKPMLVELDSLRSMSSTWQTAQREASRKEFDYIQQLAAAKARGDRLDAQLRERSDEIDILTRQVAALRDRSGVDASVAGVVSSLAASGRLRKDELARIGTVMDGHVELPPHCPKCRDGEPELSQADDGYELSCPECDRSSGVQHSRLEAVAHFMSD